MIHELFRQTQDNFRIKGTDLAAKVGISTKHLSKFRQGKANITVELLWQLVEAMERIAPGARQNFGELVAGKGDLDRKPYRTLSERVEEMSNEEFGELLMAVGKELRNRKSTVVKQLIEA